MDGDYFRCIQVRDGWQRLLLLMQEDDQ